MTKEEEAAVEELIKYDILVYTTEKGGTQIRVATRKYRRYWLITGSPVEHTTLSLVRDFRRIGVESVRGMNMTPTGAIESFGVVDAL